MSAAPAAIVYPPAVIKGSTWLQTVKMWIVTHVGLEKDALHIYFVLFLLFGSVMLFRWSLRSWKPYTLILAVLTCLGDGWRIKAFENVTLTDPRSGATILRR